MTFHPSSPLLACMLESSRSDLSHEATLFINEQQQSELQRAVEPGAWTIHAGIRCSQGLERGREGETAAHRLPGGKPVG